MGEVEFFASAQCDGGAQHAPCVFEHEIDLLWRYFFSSNDEVALVFTVFVIDDDDEFPVFEIFDSIFYAA